MSNIDMYAQILWQWIYVHFELEVDLNVCSGGGGGGCVIAFSTVFFMIYFDEFELYNWYYWLSSCTVLHYFHCFIV